MCSSADGRCEAWDNCWALLPLSSQQHTPKPLHCCSWALCPCCCLPVPSSFLGVFVTLCFPPEFPTVRISALFLNLALSFAENPITSNTLALPYDFLSSFTLFCHCVCYPLAPRSWHCDQGAWAGLCWKAGNLMTAAGWKRPGKQSCTKFREMKQRSLEVRDDSQTVVATQQIQTYSGDLMAWRLLGLL